MRRHGHKPAAKEKEVSIMVFTADREAGNKIEAFGTSEEAKNAIAAYEAADKMDGTYTPEFYDVINEYGESIV